MPDPRVKLSIALTKSGSASAGPVLKLELWQDSALQESHELQIGGNVSFGYIATWLLNAAKNLFLRTLPVLHLELDIPEAVLGANRNLSETLGIFRDTVLATNQFLLDHSYLKNIAANHERVLFYSVDHHEQFEDLFRRIREREPERFFLGQMSCGFDPSRKKTLEASVYSPLELAETVVSQRVRSIVSINMYFPQIMLREHNLHLPSVLAFMGVEYVILDYDIYDLSPFDYLMKSAFHHDGFRRYSVYPHVQAPWDDFFGLKNVSYMPYFRSFPEGPSIRPLDEDYRIVCLTHSRVQDVLSSLPAILYILEHFDEANLFDEIQLWYYTMRRRILKLQGMEAPDFLRVNTTLYFLYLAVNSFLKFEALDQIRTEREVWIFGDIGWKEYFPKYYQERYLNTQEKRELFQGNKSAHLLINANYSYLECNPSIHDPMHRNVPYITMPAMAKIPGLKGLERLEYRNTRELNDRISRLNEYLQNENFKESLDYFKALYGRCGTDFMNQLSGRFPAEGVFRKETEKHLPIAEIRMGQYEKERGDFLGKCFDFLISGRAPGFAAENSHYAQRGFVQRMLRAKARSA